MRVSLVCVLTHPLWLETGIADQTLQRGVAGPDDLVLVEPDDQLGGYEPRRHIAPNDFARLAAQVAEGSRTSTVGSRTGRQSVRAGYHVHAWW